MLILGTYIKALFGMWTRPRYLKTYQMYVDPGLCHCVTQCQHGFVPIAKTWSRMEVFRLYVPESNIARHANVLARSKL